MSKYNEELAEQIVSYIEDDTYSISEICEILNISRKTFYEWQNIKPEFRKAVKEAKECFDEKLEATARRSLMRKINNYNLIDIYKTYIPDPNDPDELILQSKVVRDREYAPDTSHQISLGSLRQEDGKTASDGKREQAPSYYCGYG
ncbi:MAG: helix-turn-helix domain-containing protein [Prevotella sp.]|jgi:predicted DNA-binding protein YlxM (UPF0122 family)|nr:helix-turn-helix domain-containing protein [Prevotella sp.]